MNPKGEAQTSSSIDYLCVKATSVVRSVTFTRLRVSGSRSIFRKSLSRTSRLSSFPAIHASTLVFKAGSRSFSDTTKPKGSIVVCKGAAILTPCLITRAAKSPWSNQQGKVARKHTCSCVVTNGVARLYGYPTQMRIQKEEMSQAEELDRLDQNRPPNSCAWREKVHIDPPRADLEKPIVRKGIGKTHLALWELSWWDWICETSASVRGGHCRTFRLA
jgi:hypothetical protein